MKTTTALHNLAHRRALMPLRVAKTALFLGAALGLGAVDPAPAAACSCISSAGLLWPAVDATGVSTRLNLVVHRAHPDVWAIDVELRDPAGELVALRERPSPEVRLSDFCGAQLVFLESQQPLAPNTKYELSFRSRDPSAPFVNQLPPPRAFTTGASTGEAEAPRAAPALELHSYRLSGDTANCKPFDPCGELVEVDLDGPALTAGEPFWFRLSAPLPDRTESLTIGFIPGSDGPSARAMVAIDPSAACVTYERIDVRGAMVETGELCGPEKCARYAPYTLRPGAHSCSGYQELGPEVWDQVPQDSCDALPLLERDAKTEVVGVTLGAPAEAPADAGARDAATPDATEPPETDPGTSTTRQDLSPATPPAATTADEDDTAEAAAAPSRRRADGCSLAPASRSIGPGLFGMLALALLACIRRMRRSA